MIAPVEIKPEPVEPEAVPVMMGPYRPEEKKTIITKQELLIAFGIAAAFAIGFAGGMVVGSALGAGKAAALVGTAASAIGGATIWLMRKAPDAAKFTFDYGIHVLNATS